MQRTREKKWPSAYFEKSPSAYFEKSPSAYFEKWPSAYFEKWHSAYFEKSPSAYFGKSPSAYFGKSPSAYFGKTSCHTIEITASRARPRLRLGPPSCRSLMPSRPPQSEAAAISRPLAQQRAARRLDQLGVRGDPFVLHPRAAVDRVPGRQPRHGGAARVLIVQTRELRAGTLISIYRRCRATVQPTLSTAA